MNRGGQASIQVEVVWRAGTRTLAWETLWRQILADIADEIGDAEAQIEASEATLTAAVVGNRASHADGV